jgi:CHAT domain-containing protein/tetratricopeptide (TPR) repeat protein
MRTLMKEITELALAGHYGDAIPLARRLVSDAERTSGPESPQIAVALQVLAQALQSQGQLAEAKVSFERELAILEKKLGPNYAELVPPLAGLGEIALAQNKLAEAARYLVRAAAIQEKAAGPDHLNTALAAMPLGNLLYRQAKYDEALKIYSRALEIFKRSGWAGEMMVPVAINNIAEVLKYQGRLELAGERYREALAIQEARFGRDNVHIAPMLNNLGDLYRHQGRLADAEATHRRTLELREKAQGPEHPDVAVSLMNLAIVFSNEGRAAEAEGLLNRALLIEEKAFGPDHPNVAGALNNLAHAIGELGRHKEAEILHRRSLAIREKSLGPAHPLVADSLYNLVAALAAQDRYDEAEPLARRSLAIRESVFGGAHPLVAGSLHSLAFVLDSMKRGSEAEPLLNRALDIRSSTLGEMHPDTAISLSNLAYHYTELQDWQAAYDTFGRATAIWVARGREKAGKSQGAAETEVRGDAQYPFRGLIAAAYKLSESAGEQRASTLRSEAFETAQLIGDGHAANAIARMSARIAAGGGDLSALVRERQDLNEQLLALDRALISSISQPAERNPEAEASLHAEAPALTKRLKELDGIIAVRFPEYAALISTTPLSIEAVQNLLKPDEALLLFTTSRDFTVVWTITSSVAQWHKAPLGSKLLAEKVRVLRCGLDLAAWAGRNASECAQRPWPAGSLAFLPEDALPFDFAVAYEIYEALFGPVEKMIEGKELILVPSGPLATIPFHVLLTEKPSPGQRDGYARAPWLVKRFATTVLPSVASLKALRQFAKKSRAVRPFIGFGNPLLDGSKTDDWDIQRAKQARLRQHCQTLTGTQQALLQTRGRRNLSILTGGKAEIPELKIQLPLPETADELCAVANSFTPAAGEVRLGAEATETEIKNLSESGRLTEYRIVHFATHGALAGQVRGSVEPGLLLTPPEQATALDDGYLTASEISSLKLDADWVVLSACNTAGAERPDAEAFSGLARAFFYAGTRALLVSHWAVGSGAAVRLTTGAIAALREDPAVGRAEALRRSMVSLIEDPAAGASHPSVWAPFVVVGEGRL